MLNRAMRGEFSKVADSDLAEAWRTLSAMKVLTKDRQANFTYAVGVRKVAGLLSQRFGLSERDVLLGRGPNLAQLYDASDDLIVAAKRAISRGASDAQAVGTVQGYSFGCLLLHNLYRLRFLSERAPEHLRAAADDLANHYAKFARFIADTPVALHDSRTTGTFSAGVSTGTAA